VCWRRLAVLGAAATMTLGLTAAQGSLAFAAPGGGNANPSTVSDRLPPPSYAEAQDSPDWVPTPVGLVYKSCVYEVPDDASVSEDGVVSANGIIERLPVCPYSGVIPVPRWAQVDGGPNQAATTGEKDRGSNSGKRKGPVPYTDGWWLDSWWSSPWQITRLSTTWTVPHNPASTGALIYLFPSVEANVSPKTAAIVQPVLQWGSGPAGGGAYWIMVNWYCPPDTSNCVHGSPVSTASGHVINGTMTRSSGTATDWHVGFTENSSGASGALFVGTAYTSWPWVQGGVLEAYHVTMCSQLPGSNVTFSGIAVTSASGAVTPQFSLEKPNASCSGTVLASSNSTTLGWTAK